MSSRTGKEHEDPRLTNTVQVGTLSSEVGVLRSRGIGRRTLEASISGLRAR